TCALPIYYFMDTYFNQFKFYKYAFTPAVRLNMKFEYNNLSVPQSEHNENEYAADELNKMENESLFNENDEDRLLLMESRVSEHQGQSTQPAELREFVRKYLSERVAQMKTEILTENGMESGGAAGKDASRKKSAQAQRKTSSKQEKNAKKK